MDAIATTTESPVVDELAEALDSLTLATTTESPVVDKLAEALDSLTLTQLPDIDNQPSSGLETTPQTTDISGVEDIKHIYENSPTKQWIKLISTTNAALFNEYTRKDGFIKVADIVLDNDISTSGKKKGKKMRNTVIKFVSSIPAKKFKQKAEWIYLFVINGRIVKIGGTRTGLEGRKSSYLCGHHVAARGKSGDCSKTNGFIYNTFEFYLKAGCTIEMYGCELPEVDFYIDIFGSPVKIIAQTYHAYESKYLDDYQKTYHDYPCLSDNCDPNYKKK